MYTTDRNSRFVRHILCPPMGPPIQIQLIAWVEFNFFSFEGFEVDTQWMLALAAIPIQGV